MYFSGIKDTPFDRRLRPFPNYLFAIAEWHLERRREPLDITARKVRNLYRKGEHDNRKFIEDIRDTLYAGFKYPEDQTIQEPQLDSLLRTNTTLGGVVALCRKSDQHQGLFSVVSYNYDDLLEFALRNIGVQYQSVWSAQQKIEEGTLPIYHVHGYIPMRRGGPASEEIIFTEEQYHLAAHNAYSWSNLVQIQCMSGSVGMMIGLSLTDRNMRRLLDAIQKTPLLSENYVLLQKREWKKPEEADLEQIDTKAKKYYKRFEESGIKTDERVFRDIKQIISQVEESDIGDEEAILEELGVYPIWYNDHEEIPTILNEIAKTP
jgi:hypothetical protein